MKKRTAITLTATAVILLPLGTIGFYQGALHHNEALVVTGLVALLLTGALINNILRQTMRRGKKR